MKIKYWKKIGENRWQSSQRILYIDKTPNSLIEYNLRHYNQKLEFSIWDGAIGTPSPGVLRMFETKSEAIKYAIKYMKTHKDLREFKMGDI